jgi:hypothetical protein
VSRLFVGAPLSLAALIAWMGPVPSASIFIECRALFSLRLG